MGEEEPFTKIMRRETRGIHNISDALVNAKLGVAMSDNKVWAEGLLIFYEIFKYLEEAMDRLKETQISKLDIPGMRRTKEFEKDLEFYLGKDWKSTYSPHASVLEYLNHLSYLEKNNPILLLAYIYHLYMGLFAGGQILRKKRAMVLKLSFSQKGENEGLAVVDLGGNMAKIKKQMAESMNEIAKSLDAETKSLLLEEGKNVFKMNNNMVRNIKGANEVLIGKLMRAAVFVAAVAAVYYYCFKRPLK